MPITWDATAEAKLMAAIFVVCDVKVSQAQLKQLAQIMGNDCTPKAITHRLCKLRKSGAETGGGKDEGGGGGEPKVKKAKLTPVVAKKGGGGCRPSQTRKRAGTPLVDSDEEEEEATTTQLTPPTTIDRRPQRGGAKRNYDEMNIKEEVVDGEGEEEDDGITVGEDIGQGLRASRPDYRSEVEVEDSELSEEGDDGDMERRM